MNIVIIDDEKIVIDALRFTLEQLTQFQISIKGTFTNANDALRFLKREAVDVVFLDIEMTDVHGLQVAKQLIMNSTIQIIFVTAHAQFAVDAFDIEATDYLLKPVHEKRLIKALMKAQKRLPPQGNVKKESKEHLFYAHTLNHFYLLNAQHEVIKWRTRKVRELFLYLWFHRKKPMLNVVIIEELWPDLEFEKAASNLHTTVYLLRKVFKDNGIQEPIVLVNNQYQLNVEVTSDYDKLISLLDQERHDDLSIQQLLNCYEGDFLAEEGYFWAIQTQLRLRRQVLQVLEMYVTTAKSNNALPKLNCLQKMLELDEFNENYMFLLLEFLIAQNKKQDCIKCYESIEQKLSKIGILVPEEIHRIYHTYIRQS
ncbi:response regulator [Lysinibacillus macroides]|uniref:Response regulator receiver protein n=1 Tax=Lysinibacillus macroides TaxID=33935 RepID=A0A0M9DJS6_9BACI|nr:response regulator [Lysinibacillus macroides]KOY82053.1 response regulator receiver protein [Lysinibacillus macroides]QPR68373.1 response regulator [Lysinibacillus macroides]